MNDQLDPIDTHMIAQRDDTARKMQERRKAKERRNFKTNTPPPPPVGERRRSERRAPTNSAAMESGSGILTKLTFILVLTVMAGAGYLYYQQTLMLESLSQTNETTNLRIAQLEAQLRASDTLLERTEDQAATSGNLTNNEISRLWKSANENKQRSNHNLTDVTKLQSSLKGIDKKLKSLTTADLELSKKDDSIRWLANQAKNESDSAKIKLTDLASKIGKIDRKIAIIDELEVAIDSIKPTDVSGIKHNQVKIINAQNILLNDQETLTNDQKNIKFTMELLNERLTGLEHAIDVIDDHRMRIQQDLADMKQTP
ncbi:MAG: hypothetical protein HRU38_14640 [Saccharospirillaceae bacterium]|nr:hypothetical protein [Pseudomonadales bacterium]NRB79879.1 hypothetical protein [Saccharospirillaceae bacterium]